MNLNTKQANFLKRVRDQGDLARELCDAMKDSYESWHEEYKNNKRNSLEKLEGDTTVNGDSAAGQAVLNIASNTGFRIGDEVIINKGGAREETGEIQIVGSASITLTSDLVYTHTAADTDTVRTMGPLYVLGLDVDWVKNFCNQFCLEYGNFWDNNPVTQRDYGKIARKVANNQ